MKKKIGIFIFALAIVLFLSMPSFAYSNYPLPVPTSNYGLVPKNRTNSNLVWDEATLEFEISEFPSNYDTYFSTNPNTLTSTYLISNNSRQSIKETFYLPFHEINGLSSYVKSRTSIYINDIKINPTIRYMFGFDEYDFYTPQGANLSNKYTYYSREFNSEAIVHKLTFQADFTNQAIESAEVNFVISNDAKARILIDDFSQAYSDGKKIISFDVTERNSSHDLYCIGEIPEYSIDSLATITVEESSLSLLDFFNQYRPNYITEVDWFNICLEKLKDRTKLERLFVIPTYSFQTLDNILNIMEFDVFIDGGQSIKIVTNNPLFPIGMAGEEDQWRLSGYLFDEIAKVKVKVNAICFLEEINGTQQHKKAKEFQLDEYSNTYTFVLNTTANGEGGYHLVLPQDLSLVLQTVLSCLFYVIPMIAMVVLFCLRKTKKGYILLYLQKIISYSLFFFGLFGLIFYPENLAMLIVLFCIFGILTILNVIEIVTKNTRSFGRLEFVTMCWVVAIYNLAIGVLFGAFIGLWIFNLGIFISIIFRISNKNKQANLDKEKYLPFGVLYNVERWITYFYFSSTMAISYVLTLVYNAFGYFFLALFLILVFYYIGAILKNVLLFMKPIRVYVKDVDINKLETSIQKLQALPEIHPETINYYNLILAQFFLAHSKEKCREYLKKCYYPKTKSCIISYRGISLRYGMTKEEFDHSFEVLKKEFYNNKRAIKSFKKFYEFWLPYYGVNPTVDVKKPYNYHRKKHTYNNAVSLFVLIYYYKNEGNLAKVK
ncbi:MAG: hypothetical protein K2M84_06600 [Anaeroplasmataceae bacterium]|nr:hypothetical protein [Anaeroplasmataceae bacterium]